MPAQLPPSRPTISLTSGLDTEPHSGYHVNMGRHARLDDFDDLTPAEKVLRLQDLWDEISDDDDAIALTDAQRQELDRRRDFLRTDSGLGSSWAEVRDRIQKQR